MRIANDQGSCVSKLSNYHTAYKYIRKSNKFLLHSSKHPGL